MRLSHAPSKVNASFDDEHLIGCAGLVPVMRLAERCDLGGLVAEHVRPADPRGVNAAAKVSSTVAGVVGGAGGLRGLDLLARDRLATACGGAPVASPPTSLR